MIPGPALMTTDIDLPRKPTGKPRYLDHQQVADLAAQCGEHDAMVLVLAYCGLRFSEATALNRGEIPIFEPGLAELVESNMRQGRLEFAAKASRIGEAEVVFIAVGTPSRSFLLPSGSCACRGRRRSTPAPRPRGTAHAPQRRSLALEAFR